MNATSVWNETETKNTLLRLLKSIAPDVETEKIDPTRSLREQTDLDSLDYLTLLEAICREFSVQITEVDAAQLNTIMDLVRHIQNKVKSA